MNLTTRWLRPAALSFLLSSILLFSAACGTNTNQAGTPSEATNQVSDPKSNEQNSNQISVVTSFYPLFFLASEIGGEHVKAVNLIPAGVEPHDWTPKSRQLETASNAKLFLYHGAGLEGWVAGFLKGLSGDSQVVTKEMGKGIALIDEAAAGAEGAHDHSHNHSKEEANVHGDVDPHTWVSPKSMIILADNVKNSLIEVDQPNQAVYEKNYAALKQRLESLDGQFTAKLSQTTNKNMVTSHQAFGYLARDYGLKQTSIMGLSPDAEPRAQDLLKIAKFVKANDVKYIFFEELVSDQLANTLAAEADVETMVLNPVEGLTPDQEKAGDTYITLMERNLQNLVQALQ